ncbi:MAG: FecR domain-containing protein [Rhodothermus sp.]|nr:FecR domain-containing protein [Rhodothermus sp.]
MAANFNASPFWEALTPEERKALQALLEQDPRLERALIHWEALQAYLRTQLEIAVPDRRLLVLYALARSGRAMLLTPTERTELEQARPALERALQALPALETVIADITSACADFEEAWAAHFTAKRHGLRAAERRSRPLRRRPVYRWMVRLALGGVVLALAGILWWQQVGQRVEWRVAAGTSVVRTLADGSIVRLVGPAVLRYAERFDRRLELEGQAYLEVQADTRPFIVETAEAIVTVLGTRLGVRSIDGQTEVVLVEGRVALNGRGRAERPVVLAPGQRSRVIAGKTPEPPVPVRMPEALAWTGLHIFNGMPLGEIVRYLSSFYNVPIRVDTSLAVEPIVGTFAQDQPLPEILQALAATLDAQLAQSAEGYHLLPRR